MLSRPWYRCRGAHIARSRPPPLADQFTTTACLTAARSAEGALSLLLE
ncbi:hypothetical protein AB0L63_09040 [Nocardia sp. NPDC051990]